MYHNDFLSDILIDLPKTQAGDDLFQIYFRHVQAVGGLLCKARW